MPRMKKRHLEVGGCVVCCFHVFLGDVDCFSIMLLLFNKGCVGLYVRPGWMTNQRQLLLVVIGSLYQVKV